MSKVYSGMNRLPAGRAGTRVTPGCLAVEGGAFRGVYAQGVMDVLMQKDINMACAVGVSAGALSAINYISGQIGRSARVNLELRNDPRYVSFRHFREYGGIINFDFCLRHLPEALDEARFADPTRRFVAVATNLETGEPEFWERSNCSDVLLGVQASASMPFVSKIVYVEGKPCLDGGCCVHIPYRWAMEEGYEKILVIRTRHRDFRYPDPEKQETLSLQIYRNYPAFAEKLSWSHRRYNAECDELQTLEDAGRVFVIAPSVTWSAAKLERDMEKLGRWYWQGCRDAQAAYPALREYLENAQNEPLGDCVR